MAVGTTSIGFEEKLWQAADKLRSKFASAEGKLGGRILYAILYCKDFGGND